MPPEYVGGTGDGRAMTHHVSQAERSEMLRVHAGLLTTMIAGDEAARAAQLKSTVQDHGERSAGDPVAFTGRMVKQIEAGALITHMVFKSLAKRLDLTDAETNEIVAQAIARLEDDDLPA